MFEPKATASHLDSTQSGRSSKRVRIEYRKQLISAQGTTSL
jgi:hypothetical protein